MGLLREDPAKWIQDAVSEGFRWIAPIGTAGRAPTRDLEFHGVTIPKGHHVETILASANLDETKYIEPDKFDIERG